MQLTDFQVLSFDCYGTLIDWETGLYHALRPLIEKAGHADRARDEILTHYARHEAEQQRLTPSLAYSELLGVVYRRLANAWQVEMSDDEADAFGASVPEWPAFPDSAQALHYLKAHYKLVVLSNVDHLSFRGSQARLGVTFDAIYTAQDIGTYKPSPRNFAYMLDRLERDFGLRKTHVLHTAQSLFHDHVPANGFGLACAWIDRRHATRGWGATLPPASMPRIDFRFTSLQALVQAHQAALAAR